MASPLGGQDHFAESYDRFDSSAVNTISCTTGQQHQGSSSACASEFVNIKWKCDILQIDLFITSADVYITEQSSRIILSSDPWTGHVLVSNVMIITKAYIHPFIHPSIHVLQNVDGCKVSTFVYLSLFFHFFGYIVWRTSCAHLFVEVKSILSKIVWGKQTFLSKLLWFHWRALCWLES